MKLIYHLPDTNSDEENSPFYIAITEIVKDKIIQVACPYIGLDYFKKIIDSCKNWELLTDLKAWVKSQQSQAKEIEKFLKENYTKIKHQHDLHAKVIIAEDTALLGSANFTKCGIDKNHEMSIIVNDTNQIDEIKEWYELWWQHAEEIIKEAISINVKKVIKDDPQNIEIKGLKRFSSSFTKKILTKDIQINAKNIEPNEDDEEKLIEYLKIWNDKRYIDGYFDLAQHIIKRFNIHENDERICIAFRSNRHAINFTIGQRWILVPYWQNKCVGLIMPLEFGIENAELEGWVGNPWFFHNNKLKEAAFLAYYREGKNIKFNDITLLEWEKAVKNELMRTTKSGFKRYHKITLYKFICDKEYRSHVLNKV